MLFIIVSGPAEEIVRDASQESVLFSVFFFLSRKETGHDEEMWKMGV